MAFFRNWTSVIAIFVVLMGSDITSAQPVGICLHSYSPEAPSEKIECFEFEKSERIENATRFFVRSGQAVVITDYRSRGIILYPKNFESITTTLELYELQAKQIPATRQFLNPWILKLRNAVRETSLLEQEKAKLPTITLADGTVLQECKATGLDRSIVTITHRDGIRKVSVADLDTDTLKALDLNTLHQENLISEMAADEQDAKNDAPSSPHPAMPPDTLPLPKEDIPAKPAAVEAPLGTGDWTKDNLPVDDASSASQSRAKGVDTGRSNPRDLSGAEESENARVPSPINPTDHGPVSTERESDRPRAQNPNNHTNLWRSNPFLYILPIIVLVAIIGYFSSVNKKKKRISPPNKILPQHTRANTGNLIHFHCSRCGSTISAEAEAEEMKMACLSCGNEVQVPSASSNLITRHPTGSNADNASHYRGKSIAVLLLLIGGTVYANRDTIIRLLPYTTLPQGKAPFKGGRYDTEVSVWKFRIGDSYDDCILAMKSLKTSGVFEDLSVTTVAHGWMPGATSINGRGSTNMNGLLTVSCNSIDLLCKNGHLSGISINYTFKSNYRSDLVVMMTKDMERFLDSTAEVRYVEDDVGNRSKVIMIAGKGLKARIRDRLDGDFSSFAPDIEISAQD